MARLSISLFGSPQIVLEGEPVSGLESDKVRALFAYLVVEADRAHRRQVLSGLLWPEWPESKARHSLSQALFNLRQAIGDDLEFPRFLDVTRQTLQFNSNSNHWLDISAFRTLLAGCRQHRSTQPEECDQCLARLQEAVALYKAAFLEGFSVRDSPVFDEWSTLKREQLHLLALDSLQRLTACHEQRSAYSAALPYARRQVELDPLREVAHQQLMRLLAKNDQRSAALEQYSVCRRILAEALGVEPPTEITALYQEIQSGAFTARGLASLTKERKSPFTYPDRFMPARALPVPPTPLIGRKTVVTRVQALLCRPDVRLVTLNGPPGVGKTRLALAVAAKAVDDYADGVVFVPLAPVRNPDSLLPTITRMLGVQESGNQPLSASLSLSLQGRKLLLVLDNFEHVISAAAVVSELLAACAGLTVLVTSREILRLQGEHEYPVPTLAVPGPEQSPSLESVLQYASVQLYVQRAQAVAPAFVLNDSNASAVAAICTSLDGLPLAIELAAARAKLLPSHEILRRLQHRFGLLRGGARDAPERHRTLRRAFAWSYDLLDAEEKALFRRLAVFVGGWTLPAAQAICAGDDSLDLLEGMTSLVDKSLVVRQGGEQAQPRFVMLESIREYGLELLRTCGEEKSVRRAHAHYFLPLAEQSKPGLERPGQLALFARLTQEHANLLAALEWSMASNETEMALRLGVGLYQFWVRWGFVLEGRSLLERLLAMTGAEDHLPEYAIILYGAGLLAYIQDELATARAYYERSLTLLRRVGDRNSEAYVLNFMADMAYVEEKYEESDRFAKESLDLYKEVGDVWGVAMQLSAMGGNRVIRGDYAAAAALCREANAILRKLGDRWGLALSLCRLGDALLCQGDHRQARLLFQESLTMSREVGAKSATARALCGVAMAELVDCDHQTARYYLDRSLAAFEALGQRRDIIRSLGYYARLAIAQKQPIRGLRLAGAAAALHAKTVRLSVPPSEQAQLAHDVAQARHALGEDAASTAWAEGQALSLEQAVAHCLGENDD